MKKRILSLLLAVSIACSMLVVPANAAASNAAVQTAVTLGGLTSEQASALSTALTRGQLAKLLVAFSAYRESAATQGNTGTLFTDVDSGNEYAPYIRIAVQQGWLSGYTDGSFRPDNGVTLEEACTAALKLLGYDVTTLSGSFPAAQLNKAGSLGLRREEICGLRWENVDLEAGLLSIREVRTEVGGSVVLKSPKTRTSARRLGITGLQDLQQVLRRAWERRRSDDPKEWVVLRQDGAPPKPDQLTRDLLTVVRRQGLPKISLHGLRHSFASVANSQGVPMFDISRTLGHSSMTVTSNIYTHLFDDTEAQALAAVARAIEKA